MVAAPPQPARPDRSGAPVWRPPTARRPAPIAGGRNRTHFDLPFEAERVSPFVFDIGRATSKRTRSRGAPTAPARPPAARGGTQPEPTKGWGRGFDSSIEREHSAAGGARGQRRWRNGTGAERARDCEAERGHARGALGERRHGPRRRTRIGRGNEGRRAGALLGLCPLPAHPSVAVHGPKVKDPPLVHARLAHVLPESNEVSH